MAWAGTIGEMQTTTMRRSREAGLREQLTLIALLVGCATCLTATVAYWPRGIESGRAAFLFLFGSLTGWLSGSFFHSRALQSLRARAQGSCTPFVCQNYWNRLSASHRGAESELGASFNCMVSAIGDCEKEDEKRVCELGRWALIDDLTGLPNRKFFADRLESALLIGEGERHGVALIYIDLDGFHAVNDSLGDAFGDSLLRLISDRIRSLISQTDVVARMGGDEFCVIVCGRDSRERAESIALKVSEALTASFTIEGRTIYVSASIGVSSDAGNGASPSRILQQARSAMYLAKRSGKNRIEHFSEELGAAASERHNLETDLRAAIDDGQIVVHFQPEFEVGSGRLVRFEALARWNHPTLGLIPPSKFIPVAEETGLIVPLGSHVMEAACRAALEWQQSGLGPIQVAVNVSSIQFARDCFVDEVIGVLERTGLSPSLLQIELTESVMLTGIRWAAIAMNRLSALGISLAIDDFGTGYSCLGYLPNLPFNTLKVDRSFVDELGVRPEIDAIVHSLVMLAHNLGMRVIAEGVETRAQFEFVARLGCNEAQGYLLGRPTADPACFLEPFPEDSRDPLWQKRFDDTTVSGPSRN